MRRLLWVSITLGLAAPFLVPISGLGAPLSGQIEGTEDELAEVQEQEGVLTTELTTLDNQISGLSGEISSLLDREAELLAELDQKRVELEQTRAELDAAQIRLEELTARLDEAEKALAARLVEIYKTDEPDALTVVLESDGFDELLERSEYLDLVSEQDQDIVARVRKLKAEVEAELARLADLEVQIETAITDIAARRDELASARTELTVRRDELEGVQSDRQAALAEVRETEVDLEGNLSSLKREQAQLEAELEAAQAEEESAPAPAPVGSESSAGFIYPVDGALSSGFGMRWGRMHNGVDIAAPAGTPIRAAASGSVVQAGMSSGYGNFTCISHSGGVSTCYAHQSSIGVSSGESVSQGEVIGSVGCTGSCTGDHLHFEVHVNGSPVDPMGYL